ncbi:MAG: hypothetical protein WAL61_18000 [Acidimicrobiales bacterium]
MVDASLWQEGPESPVTEWRATVWGMPTLFSLMGIVFGLGFLVIGADHLVAPTSSISRLLALGMIVGGLWFAGLCGLSALFTVKSIRLREDGDLVFTAWRREVRVQPGGLLSVQPVVFDWNRLLPFRVDSDQGTLWLWPRFTDMDTLWDAFLSHSLLASVAPLSPTFPWSRSG